MESSLTTRIKSLLTKVNLGQLSQSKKLAKAKPYIAAGGSVGVHLLVILITSSDQAAELVLNFGYVALPLAMNAYTFVRIFQKHLKPLTLNEIVFSQKLRQKYDREAIKALDSYQKNGYSDLNLGKFTTRAERLLSSDIRPCDAKNYFEKWNKQIAKYGAKIEKVARKVADDPLKRFQKAYDSLLVRYLLRFVPLQGLLYRRLNGWGGNCETQAKLLAGVANKIYDWSKTDWQPGWADFKTHFEFVLYNQKTGEVYDARPNKRQIIKDYPAPVFDLHFIPFAYLRARKIEPPISAKELLLYKPEPKTRTIVAQKLELTSLQEPFQTFSFFSFAFLLPHFLQRLIGLSNFDYETEFFPVGQNSRLSSLIDDLTDLLGSVLGPLNALSAIISFPFLSQLDKISKIDTSKAKQKAKRILKPLIRPFVTLIICAGLGVGAYLGAKKLNATYEEQQAAEAACASQGPDDPPWTFWRDQENWDFATCPVPSYWSFLFGSREERIIPVMDELTSRLGAERPTAERVTRKLNDLDPHGLIEYESANQPAERVWQEFVRPFILSASDYGDYPSPVWPHPTIQILTEDIDQRVGHAFADSFKPYYQLDAARHLAPEQLFSNIDIAPPKLAALTPTEYQNLMGELSPDERFNISLWLDNHPWGSRFYNNPENSGDPNSADETARDHRTVVGQDGQDEVSAVGTSRITTPAEQTANEIYDGELRGRENERRNGDPALRDRRVTFPLHERPSSGDTLNTIEANHVDQIILPGSPEGSDNEDREGGQAGHLVDPEINPPDIHHDPIEVVLVRLSDQELHQRRASPESAPNPPELIMRQASPTLGLVQETLTEPPESAIGWELLAHTYQAFATVEPRSISILGPRLREMLADPEGRAVFADQGIDVNQIERELYLEVEWGSSECQTEPSEQLPERIDWDNFDLPEGLPLAEYHITDDNSLTLGRRGRFLSQDILEHPSFVRDLLNLSAEDQAQVMVRLTDAAIAVLRTHLTQGELTEAEVEQLTNLLNQYEDPTSRILLEGREYVQNQENPINFQWEEVENTSPADYTWAHELHDGQLFNLIKRNIDWAGLRRQIIPSSEDEESDVANIQNVILPIDSQSEWGDEALTREYELSPPAAFAVTNPINQDSITTMLEPLFNIIGDQSVNQENRTSAIVLIGAVVDESLTTEAKNNIISRITDISSTHYYLLTRDQRFQLWQIQQRLRSQVQEAPEPRRSNRGHWR